MKVTEEELKSEIETCVAHIARRCGMYQDEVWEAMYDLSKEKTDGTKNICTIRPSSAA